MANEQAVLRAKQLFAQGMSADEVRDHFISLFFPSSEIDEIITQAAPASIKKEKKKALPKPKELDFAEEEFLDYGEAFTPPPKPKKALVQTPTPKTVTSVPGSGPESFHPAMPLKAKEAVIIEIDKKLLPKSTITLVLFALVFLASFVSLITGLSYAFSLFFG